MMKTSPLSILYAAGLFLAVGAHAGPPFKVTNTNDAGAGSLRDAIEQANATPGADQIVFKIPGAGPHVIQPRTLLPPLTEAVKINGSSQDGIVLDGELQVPHPTFPRTGIIIFSDDSTVQGLEIRGFFSGGVDIVGLGTSVSGNIVKDNDFHDNSHGIYIIALGGNTSADNTVKGNHIHNNSGTGLWVYSSGAGSTTSNNNVKDNHVHDNRVGIKTAAIGAGSWSSNNTFKDNHVHDNLGGMGIFPVFGTCADNTIKGNHIHHNSDGVVIGLQEGLASGNTVENNNIHNNGNVDGDGCLSPTCLGGVHLGVLAFVDGLDATLSGTTVKNNIIHDNVPHGIWLSVATFSPGGIPSGNPTVTDNTIENNQNGVST
jgi:parallel beta-helix repeat protein